MIISKTPLRISFVGGGTDFSDYYRKYGGAVISATIDKYIYISVEKSSDDKFHFNNESVTEVGQFQHVIVKETLEYLGIDGNGPLNIKSWSDLEGGTGLGSSSAFTVGLLNALYTYLGEEVSKEKLAEDACNIEINKLNHPIGKQDQYAAAYGGVNFYKFNEDNSVIVSPINLKAKNGKLLQNKLMMFYTGITRKANDILSEQKKNTSNNIDLLNVIKSQVYDVLATEELTGEILLKGWNTKKHLARGINNELIETAYNNAIKAGAIGGKVLGAGGGGYILIYCDEEYQDNVIDKIGLKQLEFRFVDEGSSILR